MLAVVSHVFTGKQLTARFRHDYIPGLGGRVKRWEEGEGFIVFCVEFLDS